MKPFVWVHQKKKTNVKIPRAYAVLSLSAGHSPTFQESQQMLLNKGLDLETPSGPYVLRVYVLC